MRKIGIQQWLKQAIALRGAMFDADAKFYLYLVDGENGAVDWHATFSTFEELIAESHLADVPRYVAFREALHKVERADASVIGVDAVIRAARVDDEVKRAECVTSLTEARRRRGMPLSGRDAGRVIQQIAPVARPTRDLIRAMSRDRIEDENKSLRREVERLQREVERLQKRLSKYQDVKKAS